MARIITKTTIIIDQCETAFNCLREAFNPDIDNGTEFITTVAKVCSVAYDWRMDNIQILECAASILVAFEWQANDKDYPDDMLVAFERDTHIH